MKKIVNYKLMLFAGIILLTFAGLSTGCKKSSVSTPSPGANEVWIQNSTFNPATITVTANTTITWTNKDSFGHTVTSDSGTFDSGTMTTDGTFTHLFTTAATITYHCNIHPMMKATVVVN